MLRQALKRLAGPVLIILALAAYSLPGMLLRATPPGAVPGTGQPNIDADKLPLLFEPNVGQAGEPARYLAHAPGANLFFTPSEVVLALRAGEGGVTRAEQGGRLPGLAAPEHVATTTGSVARLRFLGSNPAPAMEHNQAAGGKVNYLTGNDPSAWRTNVPLYGELTYRNLYNGIDLTYSGNQGRLKGTYTVAPGADPSTIRWRYEGANIPTTDEQGNLQITLNSVLSPQSSVLTEAAPVAWQEIGDERIYVAVGYMVRVDGSVGFDLGSYNPAHPLVIDPTLTYSTYLGGSGTDAGYGIAVDAAQNIYLAGTTGSTNYPLQDPLQPTIVSAPDIFITKLNAAGNALVYSTYLGGSGIDWAKGIAVDGAGNVAVAGHTYSPNFPMVHPRQPTLASLLDGFVLKLNAQGSALVFSTYLGGSAGDMAWGVDMDPAGNVYVSGDTDSTNFPTFNAIQPAFAGGEADAFVTKYTADGLAYVYSTYLGGDLDFAGDIAHGIAADSAGNAYVTGDTTSLSFPVANAMFPTYRGGESDAFITKLNPTGSAFIYSTYFGGGMGLGGTGADTGYDIAADSAGNAYITGDTDSTDFPTRNPIHPNLTDFYDVFITKMNPTGSDLVYSTYMGGHGAGNERGQGIDVNAAGEAAVVGIVDSADFPVANAVQPIYGGAIDAFAIKLTASGTQAAFVTYLGGTGSDYGQGAAIDNAGNVYATGLTASTNFPIANPYQDHNSAPFDVFISKIADGAGGTPTATPSATRTVTPTPTFGCAMGTRTVVILESGFLPQNITITVGTTVNWLNEGPAQHTTTSDTGVWNSGTLNPGQTFQFTFNTPGTYPYHCAIHPGMVGSITVQPSTCTPSPVPTATRTPTRSPTRTSTPIPNTATSTGIPSATVTRTVTPTPTIGCMGSTRSVIIVESGFLPQHITITVGTTVNWLNEGPAQHTTTSDTGVWDSGTLNPGQTFQHAFHVAGTYPYHCAIHPGMVGNITVQPGACTPSPVPTATGTSMPGTPTATLGAASATPTSANPTSTNTATAISSATSEATSTSIPSPTACAAQFADVPQGSTFYPYVRCLACRGIIGGYPCGGPGEPCDVGNTPYFRPNGSVTRGQIAKIVSNAAGFSDPVGAQQFEDVLPGSTFYDFIWRLADREIVSGYACGGPGEPCGAGNLPYFRPNGNATRGQITKIVSESAGFSDPPGAQQFEDMVLGSTFFDFAYRLAIRGIMNGYACGGPGEPCGAGNLPYFRPNNDATRGQLSKIASNTFFPECNPPRR